MNDQEYLRWLRDRLVHVYGESPNVDFVQKLSRVADSQGQQRANGLTRALLDYIRLLESQRNDARRMVTDSGYFTNLVGVEYVGKSKPDHYQFPPSEQRLPPLKARERADGATCPCNWCAGGGPS